jgi:putative transposase
MGHPGHGWRSNSLREASTYRVHLRTLTDRGKRGAKRLVLTDGRGVPLGGVIDGVNCNDRKLMRQTIEAIPIKRPNPTRRRPQHLCLDKGFDYDEPRALAAAFGFTLHLRTRGEEAHAKRHAGAKARRWVVERTHSWLNRFRSILCTAPGCLDKR